jgi:FtsH-binding integral membrane protein
MSVDPFGSSGNGRFGSSSNVYAARGGSDAAAQAFMTRVYSWMAGGLGVTALFAWMVASSPTLISAILGTPLFYGIVLAELGMVWGFSRMVRTASFNAAAAMFLAYCALNGLTFSIYLLVYTGASVASVFVVTGGTFGAMSLYGTVTKKDLSSWSGFLMMGLIGVLLAGVVNIFLQSSALYFILSCASVVVFTGLTAYDTQKIRQMADADDDRLALHGALQLYLDFVNLFIALLQLFGKRRN